MLDRRQLLKRSGALGTGLNLGPRLVAARAEGTPAADEDAYPTLAITVTDDGYDVPANVVDGRHQVTVTNASSGQSHLSLGWIPETISDDQVVKWQDDDPTNDGSTELFSSLRFVGLPDFPKSGETRSGIVDLPEAGCYLLFDPFRQKPQVVHITGSASPPADPAAEVEVTLAEMSITLPAPTLTSGKARWKVVNMGAFTHELQILPVAPGTSEDELGAHVA